MASYGPEVVAQVIDDLGIEIRVEHGKWGSAPCPLHDDASPSFTIHLEDGAWKCYAGCGSSNDLAVLVAEATGEDVRVARRRLLRGMPVTQSALDRVLAEVTTELDLEEERKAPLNYQHGVVHRYLLDRGFTVDTCKEWDIGWDPAGAIVLPATEHGSLVGLVRRNLNKPNKKYENSEGFYPGKRGHLWGLDHVLPESDWCILTEGPLDALWLWQCGWPAVSLLGSSLSSRQAEAIKRRFWRVVTAFDADLVGQKITREATKELASLWVQRLPIQRGKKDVQQCSHEYLQAALDNLSFLTL